MTTRLSDRLHAVARYALIVVVGALCDTAFAARIEILDIKNAFCDKLRGESACLAIRLTGNVESGDNAKLVSVIEGLERRAIEQLPVRVGTVFLDSGGGEIGEAMKLGRTIRERQLSTVVAQPNRCASACVIVLAGGVMRFPVGRVEVHSFYSPDLLGTRKYAKAEAAYRQVAAQVTAYLKDMRISAALLDEMIRIPHNRSRVLDTSELEQLSLFGIDPVYAQVRPADVRR